jgi:hypothetical protein
MHQITWEIRPRYIKFSENNVVMYNITQIGEDLIFDQGFFFFLSIIDQDLLLKIRVLLAALVTYS